MCMTGKQIKKKNEKKKKVTGGRCGGNQNDSSQVNNSLFEIETECCIAIHSKESD